jgi:ankyrin repeat protein
VSIAGLWGTAKELIRSTIKRIGPMSDDDFLELCKNGTPEEIEHAIQGGANVNAADKDNWTALHFSALSNENYEVARVLIENGANINARDDYGDTPLMNAVYSNLPKHILLLLDMGADTEIKDNKGKKPIDYLSESTPEGIDDAEWDIVKERFGSVSERTVKGTAGDEDFIELCKSGTPEEIERAIQGGANVNAADKDNWTALHFAALSNKNHEVARVLIENGANINARDNDGDTPLMNAVINNWPKHILLLLDMGADANIADKSGKTPMHYLSESTPEGVDNAEWETVIERLGSVTKRTTTGAMIIKDLWETMKVLVRSTGKNTAGGDMSDDDFIILCRDGTPEEIERAIKDGANVSAADEDNWTALHFAVLSNENPEAIRILLDNGANINARDNDGDTPLMNAVIRYKTKHILLLLDKGADAGIADNYGNTPQYYLPDSTPDGVDEEEWKEVIDRLKI